MVTEATRFGQYFASRLDRLQQHRQAFVNELLGQFERHKALLEKFKAKELMQQLAAQIRERGLYAEVIETPVPQIATEDVRYNGWSTYSQNLRYRVGIEWGKNEGSEKQVYEVVGMDYDSGKTVSFGHNPGGYNPLSAEGMSIDQFGDHLISNFLLGTAAQDVF